MNEVEVKILKLSGLNGFCDLLCSIYSDNYLLDAFTVDSNLTEPIVFAVPGNMKQKLMITIKCISLNSVLGFVKFKLDDLIDPEFVLTLPIALPQDSSHNANIPNISLQLMPRSQGFFFKPRSKSEDFSELRSLRGRASQYENKVMDNLWKMHKTVQKHEKKEKTFKSMLKNFTFDYLSYKNRLTNPVFLIKCAEKQKKLKTNILDEYDLEATIINNKVRISYLKAEGLRAAVDIKTVKRHLVVEKAQEEVKDEDELQREIERILQEISKKEKEIEAFNKIAKNSLEQIMYLQESNALMREKMEVFESFKVYI